MIHIAIAATLLATPAAAQDSGRERADAMIARANAADLFENISDPGDDIAVIRHLGSGMTCAFPDKIQGELMISPDPGTPRGDDVGCDLKMPQITVTLYATRANGATTASELEGASAMLRSRWPDAKPWPPTGSADMLIPPDRRSPQVDQGTRWFMASENGKPLVTRLSVATVGDWTITERATAWDQSHAEVMEMFSSMVWYANLEEMAKAPAPPPAS